MVYEDLRLRTSRLPNRQSKSDWQIRPAQIRPETRSSFDLQSLNDLCDMALHGCPGWFGHCSQPCWLLVLPLQIPGSFKSSVAWWKRGNPLQSEAIRYHWLMIHDGWWITKNQALVRLPMSPLLFGSFLPPAQGESGNHCCWRFHTEEKFGHPSGNWHLEDFDCGQHSSLVDWTGLRRLEDEWRLLGFSSTENSCRWQPAFMQGSTIHKASFHKCQKRHTESMIWATIWVWPRALRKWSCCL